MFVNVSLGLVVVARDCVPALINVRWALPRGKVVQRLAGVSEVHDSPWVHPLCQVHDVFHEVAA